MDEPLHDSNAKDVALFIFPTAVFLNVDAVYFTRTYIFTILILLYIHTICDEQGS